jgi:hypothetical protein
MSTDRVESVSAMVVAVASLGFAGYQATLLRQWQAAAVLPYVMVSLTANDDGTYVVVRNSGVGPALVEDVRIRHRGRALETDPYEFYVTERGLPPGIALEFDKLPPGRLISAGEWVLTLGAAGEGADALLEELLGVFDIADVPNGWYDAAGVPRSGPDKAVVEITYSSLQGERWRVTSNNLAPERLP